MISIRQIPFSEIVIDRKLVYNGLGYGGGQIPDSMICDRVEGMIAEIADIANPRYIYNLVDAGPEDRTCVTAGNVRFMTGRVIAPFFAAGEKIAVFVATTGVEFEEWLHGIKRKGDILDEFMADSIGSAFAEAVALKTAFDMELEQEALGNCISNSYSPGYCGWNVKDQRKLFSLLPPYPCGVTLSDSCLMTPIKSVSGLISVGSNVRKHPYGCEICDKEGCFRKNI